MAEKEIIILKRTGLKKRIATISDLNNQVKSFVRKNNKIKKTIDWSVISSDAKKKMKRLCE
jgi:cell shape-determining protein MreC